jgi:hypothetical protein
VTIHHIEFFSQEECSLDQAIGWIIWRDLRVVSQLDTGKVGPMFMYPPDEADGSYGTLSFGGKALTRKSEISQFKASLRAGLIKIRGLCKGEGEMTDISPEMWRDLEIVTHPLNYAFVRPENGIGTWWNKIKVSVQELIAAFPPVNGETITVAGSKWADISNVSLTHTGRPTKSSQIYIKEFLDRVEKGDIEETLAEQARILLAWFKDTYPLLPCSSVNTIEDRIRSIYRKANAAKLNKK